MATRDADNNGDIMTASLYATGSPLQAAKGRFITWGFNPSSTNQGYTPFYKMRGFDTGVAGGWQTWENSSGDEANRPAPVGTQTPGTVVASWFVLFGGS